MKGHPKTELGALCASRQNNANSTFGCPFISSTYHFVLEDDGIIVLQQYVVLISGLLQIHYVEEVVK
jgi:hypothetical protein